MKKTRSTTTTATTANIIIDKTLVSQIRRDTISFLADNSLLQNLIPLHGMNLERASCTCKNYATCSSKGKHPKLSKSWRDFSIEDVTKHLEQKKFYDYNKDKKSFYNLGFACGIANERFQNKRIIVVDIDHKDPWNLEYVNTVLNKGETFGYMTGSGGLHLWFLTDLEIPNSVKSIHENIDIRGTGGYVILPGSLHVPSGGNLYHFDESKGQGIHRPILELPTRLKEALLELPQKKTAPRQKTAKKRNLDDNGPLAAASTETIKTEQVLFGKLSFQEMKQRVIQEGTTKVPLGMRNITIYKLLSEYKRIISKIRKNISAEELYSKAKEIRDLYCEEAESFSEKELYTIVYSVKKQKIKKESSFKEPYAKSYKDLAGNYFSWMETNRSIKYSNDAKEKMIKADEQFFSLLTATNIETDFCKDSFVSLNYIHQMRDKYLREVHGINTYFRYPLKFLAEKLSKQYDFERRRTAKCNVWLVYVPINKMFNNATKNNQLVEIKEEICYNDEQQQEEITAITEGLKDMSEEAAATPTTIQEQIAVVQQQVAQAGQYPVWASKEHKPTIVTGINLPDPNSPNYVPLYTPPGFKDEVISREGKYVHHENDQVYSQFGFGRRTYMELTEKVTDFIETLTAQEANDFSEYNFIRNEEQTASSFDEIKEGDIVGLMLQKDPMATYAIEVLKVIPGADMFAGRLWDGNTKESKYSSYKRTITNEPSVNSDLVYVTFQDVSYSIAVGNFNILYRMNTEEQMQQEIQDKEDFALELNKKFLKEPTKSTRQISRRMKERTLFSPYGYEDKKKQYNMIIRYRITDTFPGYVPDEELESQNDSAYAEYLEANKDKFDAIDKEEQELLETKQNKNKELLAKRQEELEQLKKKLGDDYNSAGIDK